MKKTQSSAKRKTAAGPAGTTAASPGGRRGGDAGENLDLAQIKELIELVSEKQFNEFELERGSFRLRLQKGANRVVVESPLHHVAVPPAHAEPAEPPPAAAPAPVQEEKLHIISSPIVGTFYRSPSPTSESFVKMGDQVEPGRTLCIIEAMKLMNEIQSDAGGTVARIYVENGQPVEYGQPLFGLRT